MDLHFIRSLRSQGRSQHQEMPCAERGRGKASMMRYFVGGAERSGIMSIRSYPVLEVSQAAAKQELQAPS